ncbi:hypothetical protein BS329_38840 [Amycolatopsis coloradensis]|uniref:Transcriptional regulator n=1 Tax=Amycolatopsis coloradensis TaxID=76021 RepID=A0A1R0KER4_9PSEU|nr:hypothetical protein [Amycolatopsis coloradensis]OLZ43617.1 hypothetical protein BS329_38840 [Amycolatopsis coloradensis]
MNNSKGPALTAAQKKALAETAAASKAVNDANDEFEKALLKAARLGLTQRTIAPHTHITQSTVSRTLGKLGWTPPSD